MDRRPVDASPSCADPDRHGGRHALRHGRAGAGAAHHLLDDALDARLPRRRAEFRHQRDVLRQAAGPRFGTGHAVDDHLRLPFTQPPDVLAVPVLAECWASTRSRRAPRPRDVAPVY